MNQEKVNYIKLIILIWILQSGSCWTFYEKGYQGNNDGVCDYDENKNRYCKDLGEHAYRGQLVDGVPKPLEYYLNDAELFEELRFIPDNDKLRDSDDMISDYGDEN